MNYPNGKPYRKNSAIDGGKKTAAFSNVVYNKQRLLPNLCGEIYELSKW
ncbi:TPA: hypothetical protein ACONB8_001244 [Staphylococcus aureus]